MPSLYYTLAAGLISFTSTFELRPRPASLNTYTSRESNLPCRAVGASMTPGPSRSSAEQIEQDCDTTRCPSLTSEKALLCQTSLTRAFSMSSHLQTYNDAYACSIRFLFTVAYAFSSKCIRVHICKVGYLTVLFYILVSLLVCLSDPSMRRIQSPWLLCW